MTGGSIKPQAGTNGAAAIDGAAAVSTTGGTGPAAPAQGGPGTSGSGSLAAPKESGAAGQAVPRRGLAGGTPVYFVALDDGGSTGVRFGCNDSLVAVFHSTAAAEEPLRAALGVLLGSGDSPAGLYNSLHNSTLDYVSAYFDGTTVVVNLTGTIRPGGTCDLPRLEAQLTHTAVSAVGAARAEIYVDGQRLADVLNLR
ncbi:GerMN domain-containing protein [Arthrobacter sp. LjRoot14]|uniref:GerMN domain-containing protein n=1 Tax=Arthrobacter sp. LjRoot14 TaxID=3342265 RepID=UPI003ED10D58